MLQTLGLASAAPGATLNGSKTGGFLGPRPLGRVNWLGLLILTRREVSRFVKVYAQTLIAPIVTTLLYYAVFALALGGTQKDVGGIPYLTFLAPGLVMMSVAQNAFANTSTSLVISKVQGNIVDILMAPLSPLELTLGYTFGAIIRGLAVGATSVLALACFVHLPLTSPGFALYHVFMGSMMLALLGLIGGIWSDKFDHLAAVQNFIITPATFLSGTFYSADKLPKTWQFLCHLNPFFYMIEGFRYGLTGAVTDTRITGLLVMAAVNGVLLSVAYVMFATGYKLKS